MIQKSQFPNANLGGTLRFRGLRLDLERRLFAKLRGRENTFFGQLCASRGSGPPRTASILGGHVADGFGGVAPAQLSEASMTV